MLYATGMRRMEIARLQISDIDAGKCLVLIREGKGRKDRLLPLGERALYWVQRYIEQGRPELMWNQQDATVFIGAEGNPLNINWLSTIVAQYVDKAQIGKSGGCHLFRHTMATLMLEGGADIRFIQAMLGHADLKTTQIYAQVAIKQLQIVHANTHPGALRRVRSAQAQADEANPQRDPESAAEALYAALDAEADEEDTQP